MGTKQVRRFKRTARGALLPLARKRKRKRTGADDGCLPEYEKDCSPSSKGKRGEEESFSISKTSQGAVPLPLLRKNEWSEIAERGFCEEARALVRGKERGVRSWR
ncbi:hypothetical protein [Halobacillus litoralis]|uniref:hypothetical protein n=1 Tax=Halobacillus litoralis TaxID=45668 RepID=UPI001CD2F34B|nr:hypothetical protein [Halobacillus litoralis]MCA1022798.1 hypothetical protein [Halobacillus litoralis]